MASVSGLLSEETAFLGSCLAVRAADQEYFGGKQVYTTVVPSTSKFLDEGHCHGHSQSHDHGHGQGRVHERDHGHRHEHKHRNVHAHGHKQGYGNSHENNHEREYDHKNSQGKELIPKPDMHVVPKCELNVAIQYAKEVIAKALSGENLPHGITFIDDIQQEVKILRKENEEIRKELAELREALEKFVRKQVIPVKESHISDVNIAEGNSVDEDFDLFGSDDEDAEKAKVVQERLKEYNEKKSKKPVPIAKSSVILDVKPWDDETNLEEMESLVRGIKMDGLIWGGAKFLPIGYGIKKLQIVSVIEDDKVSIDELIEKITEDFESHVQSVDIVAFNKI